MTTEKSPRNDTEVRQSISIYPIPAPIYLYSTRGLIGAEFPGNDTEKIQKICLSVHITLTVGKEAFPCQEVSGETLQECNKKDAGFSYKKVKPSAEKYDCSLNKGFEKSTQEFFDEYYENKPQLTNLHIEITSKCNERCVYCYIPHENKTNSMDSDLFYNILEQCKKMNLLHLTISGGEPMTHHSFIEFLKKCNEYNFSVNVLSNLTLKTEIQCHI